MTQPANDHLPLAIYALALGTFCVGTSKFMLAGLLPELAGGLGVAIPQAGLLITVFAVGPGSVNASDGSLLSPW